ncbi:MAG: DNA replication/repair protein RecF [Ruminococcaceae bacterium]|nr:DNA replication/repair protein RecF [Oscillospiraceae bacterium]
MHCKKIRFRDFRNIENEELEFSPDVNIFIGSNAQGKTSALEGIYLFARGKSFRTQRDAEMIRFGCDYASVDTEFNNGIRDQKMRIAYSRDGRRLCKRNGVDIKKLSEMVGQFRAVIFCPSHLSLVKDGPSVRRSFIDSAISQIEPSYISHLQKYNLILSQRNALIKNAFRDRRSFDATVEYWSQQLSEEAEIISRKREKYVKILSEYSNEFIADMTLGKEELSLLYRSVKSKEEYMQELMSNHEREIKYGSTLYGVHKDDIDISICGHEARSYASQGQQRSIALALKLSEGEISKKECGSYPVFLLDDVLSELDSKRREYVLSGVRQRQTFITSCNTDDFSNIKNMTAYKTENGRFEKCISI